ncbi:NAD(P)-dependent oxidoreductase [Actinokineospora sp. NBRC 105648]|uniref:NAD(P)-dependent oxidoreductase n=1 Tax=Actinokineospora sp. NBRC 105648 TaxID=3032206 RepID=UPI0024A0F691|nr:NAD(P)-dependent oxidoreductase [Actinokineospora sp. NBRC 105648]GLZ39153.1 dehydrogenase [Actinokineospora sp. NBRC 105648]
MDATPTIAVLGTGIIGAPVARNLAAAGFDVRAWNRTRDKAAALAPHGVRVAGTPAEAVAGAKIVLTVLKDAPAVLAAVTAAAPGLAHDVVWVQLSTVGEAVDELAAFAAERGLTFVDAPVLGTRQPAEQGQLVVLAAGDPAVRGVVQPLFDAIGKKTVWVADDAGSGSASRLKLVLNTWVLALNHGVGEALALAKGLGVDPAHFVDAVTGGPLDNGYFQTKSAAIRAGDYTTAFSVDNAEKDARLVLAAAEHAGVRLDATAAGAQRLARASALGHGDDDMAAGYFASFTG